MNPKDFQIMDDQIILASKADKCFGDIREKAKKKPQFILDNDKIDSVVLSIEQYEQLLSELEKLRETLWHKKIEERIKNDSGIRYSAKDFMSKEEYEMFINGDPLVSDEELFE